MSFKQKTYLFYIISILILIFISYFYFDKPVALYFIEHKETYESIGSFLSIFGQSHWYFIVAIAGIVYNKYFKQNELYKQRFLFLFYINLLSGFISVLAKFIFGRYRPWGLRNGNDDFGFLLFQNFDMGLVEKFKYQFSLYLQDPTPYTSFPSGHTTTIFAVYVYLNVFFPKYIYLWFTLAALFSGARILESDHFVSDILGGILVGSLSTAYIYSKMRKKL